MVTLDPQTVRGATFGALDGLVTCLAIVLGVYFGGLEPNDVIITALASAFAGACSMASGEVVSMTAHNSHEKVESQTSPYKVGAASFISFLLGSALVIVPMLVLPVLAVTIFGVFAMGALGYFTTTRRRFVAAMRSIMLGSTACLITTILGYLLGSTLG